MSDAHTDTRAFDGPFDKQVIRRGNRAVVAFLKSDLYVRVPGVDGEPTHGTMEEVENQPTDQGRRWTHTYDVMRVRDPLPVSFDAGRLALYVSPLGWRVLYGYVKDDPTYGFEATIYTPRGMPHSRVEGISDLVFWLEDQLP